MAIPGIGRTRAIQINDYFKRDNKSR
ncbi:MAG: hypothetical protein K8S24_06750 [Candidatus Aegiribacteria sp.]|nr:hypothetical protein [Candidatus Aegiribacteria sp.]